MQGSNKVYGIVIFGEGLGEGREKKEDKGGRGGEITSFLFDGRGENYHIPVSFKHFKYFSERKISNYANTSFPPPPSPPFLFYLSKLQNRTFLSSSFLLLFLFTRFHLPQATLFPTNPSTISRKFPPTFTFFHISRLSVVVHLLALEQ